MGIGVTFGLGLNVTLAAAAVWLVLLCATLRVARRRGVRSAPATANLGPERPAIAGLYDRGVVDAPRAATARRRS